MLTNLYKKIPFFYPLLSLFIFNALLIAIYVLLQTKLPPIIPIYYGLPKGEEQLAHRISIIIPPAISIAVLTINALLLSLTKNDFIQKIYLGIGLVVTMLSTVTTLRIFLLVANL